MKKLKIGIIGCGFIANGKHLPSLAIQQDVEVVAFCLEADSGDYGQDVAERAFDFCSGTPWLNRRSAEWIMGANT